MHLRSRRGFVVAAMLLLAACNPGPADRASSKAAAAPAASPSIDVGPPAASGTLTWTAPAGWQSEPPASSMRRAQYRVPGEGGAAECLVFYFGPGQGGDPAANAQRWASQFTSGTGGDAAPLTTSTTKVGTLPVTLVEVKGTYLGGMGSDSGQPKPGYQLLGAVVEAPDGNWFFKLTGPAATVEGQRASFQALVQSLR
jgi:hypothetical protein